MSFRYKGKVVASTGGESFATDDTLTNENNVLGVATPVKGIVTQAEFDALPEAQRNNGFYVIVENRAPVTYVWWSPHMTSDTTPAPYVVATNHDHASYPSYTAFDGNESTGWATGTISTKAWISFDFGELTSVDGLRMMPLSVDPVSCMPHTGSIQGSRDGTTWIDIVSFAGLPVPSDRNFREHMFTEVLYRYYRIYDMQSYSTQQNYVSIGEIQFHKAVRV